MFAQRSLIRNAGLSQSKLSMLSLVLLSMLAIAALALRRRASRYPSALPRAASLSTAGIAANAVAVIAVAQIHNHDDNEGLLKIRSSQFRARVSQEHPKPATHTLIVLVSVLAVTSSLCCPCIGEAAAPVARA